MARRKSRINAELLDELLAGEDPREAFQSGELFAELEVAGGAGAGCGDGGALVERGGGWFGDRNGHNRKRVLTGTGSASCNAGPGGTVRAAVDREVGRRLPGFDEKVISLYARGMTTREIRAHVRSCMGLRCLVRISKVTDEIHEELREWRSRPLEAVYPIVYFDALRVNDEGVVQNQAVHLAIGVTALGVKEILGMWTAANEGASSGWG